MSSCLGGPSEAMCHVSRFQVSGGHFLHFLARLKMSTVFDRARMIFGFQRQLPLLKGSYDTVASRAAMIPLFQFGLSNSNVGSGTCEKFQWEASVL